MTSHAKLRVISLEDPIESVYVRLRRKAKNSLQLSRSNSSLTVP